MPDHQTLCCRLHGLIDQSGIRREMSPLASRSVHLVLEFLSLPSGSSALTRAALELVYTVLTVLPVSIRSHSEKLELVLCQIMASRDHCADIGASSRECAARCLALVPRSSPEPTEAWGHMMKKTLLTMADATDAVFMGLDDHVLSARAR